MSENPVQETASLHEGAVQAIARGDVQPQPKRRRRAVSGPPAASAVRITVDNKTLLERECQRIISEAGSTYTSYALVDAYTAVVR
jgi:hypothetical protein